MTTRGVFSVFHSASLDDVPGRTHLRGAETGGTIGLFEGLVAPGGDVHWHTHTREDETFRVLAGTFRFWCGEDVVDAGPGSTVFAPRNIRHRWQNIGSIEGHLLFIVNPGGFETFFDDIAALPEVTPAAIAALEETYGIISELLQPTDD